MAKILHISNYYYPHIGGIETATRDIVNVLKNDNHIQKVICFGDGPTFVDDIQIIRLPYKVKIASQAISFKYFKVLKKTIEEFIPDIIFIHTPNPLVEHYFLKCHYKGRVIIYHHLDVYRQKILKHFVRPTQRHLNERADVIVCHSKQYIDHSEELKDFTKKCRIIPLCFKDNDFVLTPDEQKQLAAIKEKYKNNTLVFYSGRHTKTKALHLGIRACKNIKNVIFIIGRVGASKRLFEKTIKSANNVVYLGQLDRRQYALYLNACDIFLFPSITKNEAFPITLIEAISLGKPCITFKVEGSGINYISPNDVTGIECENGNVYALKVAVCTLKGDKRLCERYAKNGINRASSLFNHEQFAISISKLINEVYNMNN